MTYIKSLLMQDFRFGIKRGDVVYVSDKVYEAIKVDQARKDIMLKLAILDYDNIDKVKEQLNLDDQQFTKLLFIAKDVVKDAGVDNDEPPKNYPVYNPNVYGHKIDWKVKANPFGEMNDYGLNPDGTKRYMV